MADFGKVALSQLQNKDKQINNLGVPFGLNLESGLANWRAKYKAMNRVLDINILGDSISEGAGATPSYRANGYVGLLRSYFNGLNDVGGGFVPAYHPYDSKLMVTTGTGWVNNSFGPTGGAISTPTANDYVEFTINADSCEIYYVKGSTAGSFKISVDGVDYATINAYNASLVASEKTTVTGLTNGTHTIRITHISATTYIIGYREVKGFKGVRLNMCARWGTQTSAAVGANSIYAINKLTPDLSIIAYVANDSNAQVTLTTYATNIQTLITNAKLTGDVLIIGNGLHNPNTTPISETQYTDVLAALALKNNCGYIDINKAWSNNGAIAAALGYYTDNVHPANAGHQIKKDIILKALIN